MLVSGESKKRNNFTAENIEVRVNLRALTIPDGNWKTIDNNVLYDKNKWDLVKYDLDTVYKIFEYGSSRNDNVFFVCSCVVVFRSSPKGLTDAQVKERLEKVSYTIFSD